LSHASPHALASGCGCLEEQFEHPTMQIGGDSFHNLRSEIKYLIKFLFLSSYCIHKPALKPLAVNIKCTKDSKVTVHIKQLSV
jgi:hypothetical protein